MTKYSKLFSFILFSIIILLGLVFYQSRSQEASLSLEVVTVEGNADELSVANFTGYAFSPSRTIQAPHFEFEEGEFIFREDRPVIQRLDYQYNPSMNRYVSEYRSFMRGKARHLSVFTETNEHIYYTATKVDFNWQADHDDHVTISRFNKETEEETAFDALLTGGSNHNIVAAYVDYPSLTIVTSIPEDHRENTWLIYSFNFDQPEEELTPVADITRLTGSDTIQIDSSKLKTERYIPFRSLEDGALDDWGHVMEYDIDTYYIYDTQSNELKEMPAFEEGELIVLTESDRIIAGNDQGEEVVWYEWDFGNNDLHELGSTRMASTSIGRIYDTFPWLVFNENIHLVNGHIYLTEDFTIETENRSLIQIVSLDTLETVYSGHIDAVSDNEDLMIDISIQELSFDPLLY
ncbi:MAG: hypothetical protein JJU01_10175 [Alkalibacterium sp.]|nr:hypothetical protein [Alkalibacterium sp.]